MQWQTAGCGYQEGLCLQRDKCLHSDMLLRATCVTHGRRNPALHTDSMKYAKCLWNGEPLLTPRVGRRALHQPQWLLHSITESPLARSGTDLFSYSSGRPGICLTEPKLWWQQGHPPFRGSGGLYFSSLSKLSSCLGLWSRSVMFF
jgi:hypothetical protein